MRHRAGNIWNYVNHFIWTIKKNSVTSARYDHVASIISGQHSREAQVNAQHRPWHSNLSGLIYPPQETYKNMNRALLRLTAVLFSLFKVSLPHFHISKLVGLSHFVHMASTGSIIQHRACTLTCLVRVFTSNTLLTSVEGKPWWVRLTVFRCPEKDAKSKDVRLILCICSKTLPTIVTLPGTSYYLMASKSKALRPLAT